MKKIGLICAVALAGMSLAACGNNKSKTTNDTASSAKVTESVNKVVKHGQQKSAGTIVMVNVILSPSRVFPLNSSLNNGQLIRKTN